MQKNKILVIAPHPDDEILGCAGTMAKEIQKGNDVFVAIMTNGHLGAPELFKKEGTERVRAEAVAAHEFLGVKDTFFLDFPCPRLDTEPSYKISIALSRVINENNIDTIYVTHRGDIHKDHRITFEATLVAARPINNNPVKKIYAYETLSETEWAVPFGDDVFIPVVFEDITEFIDLKIKAFEYFTTQIKEFPHPRSVESIKNLAKYRGATVGFKFAEAFSLIREIRK
ncbi:MAG: PIG-L deacetylase family protein [Candidatus Cyclobacteriaceae bacterium M2_1C_046]